MKFNLIDKKYVGIFSTLFLIILLSQSRVFDFLIDTVLGRTFLILFILGISYTNKILGVASVLFIIIMFNQSNIGYMEGFTDNNTQDSPNTQEIKDKINSKKDEIKTNLANSTAANTSSEKIMSNNTTSTSSTSENFVGQEGFNIIDRESSILKGKRSNEVQTFSNNRNKNEYVEPFDNFDSNYLSTQTIN
jgi:hypothetical protein